MPDQPKTTDMPVIGIPRTLLYYRYGILWKTFFETLGLEVVLSEPTDRSIIEEGERLSVDECCLASKCFMGHVNNLIGKCDLAFIPCYSSENVRGGFCTKMQSVPDMAKSIFIRQIEDPDIRFNILTCYVGDALNAKSASKAFIDMGMSLGFEQEEARRAWKAAYKAQMQSDSKRANGQEELLHLSGELGRFIDGEGSGEKPLTILVAAHPYIIHDRYLGSTVTDALSELGAIIIYADETSHEKAYKKSFEMTETMPWCVNRELIGSILLHKDQVDGVVIVTAFPCGPDSMANDAIDIHIKDIPILTIMIDSQTGSAGIETRIESFMDILRYRRRGGYIHA